MTEPNGCCGWPVGCTNMNPACLRLQHPYKRWVRGEISKERLDAWNALVRGRRNA